MRAIKSFRLDNFLSFGPESEPFEMGDLNVLIGVNGSGKSNLIEAFELLGSAPTNFASAIRDGGGAPDWIWKGADSIHVATLDAVLADGTPRGRPLRHRLEFTAVQSRVEVLDEAIEEASSLPGKDDVYFYYRFQRGRPAVNVVNTEDGKPRGRHIERTELEPDQSVLAQLKDSEQYPEITWLGRQLGGIQTFREWTFGRYTNLREPQRTDLPEGRLLPDASNLSLVLQKIQHVRGNVFDDLLRRFLPRFNRLSTMVSGNTIQFYLHEPGFSKPIPATRLSDGTLRFIAILAVLLAPEPPPLVCLEEPELGLHPDAVALVAEVLKTSAQQMQLLVTTHSDALVAALSDQPDALVACEREGAGTTLRRLDTDQLSELLKDYTLGDLWRMGEIGANP
ncbi:MAG: AAA family ATPase [Gammaproteobacteria bacterium]|nr:AAA family ATPase [Gammaproteobacteria bacterium]